MDSLLRFGTGDELYTFDPTKQISLQDNFRDVLPRTTRLPGLTGGYDEYGTGIAPTEIGNVQVFLWIEGNTPAEMQAAKKALGAMKAWGKKKLFKQPIGDGEERFCDARVISIKFTESARDVPHQRIRVQIDFLVADPHWYNAGTYTWLWGAGSLWGGGQNWGGTPISQNAIGFNTEFMITPAGNDIIIPRIQITVPNFFTAENIRIQRKLGGTVLDEVSYMDVLTPDDLLDINCPAYQVKLNSDNAYNSKFDIKSGAWFRLRGGLANSIRVRLKNSDDFAVVKFKYYEAYNV